MTIADLNGGIGETIADDRRLIEQIQSAACLETAYAARNALTKKYLPLSRAAARRAVPKHLRHLEDDCCQEGACALLEAASRIHLRAGTTFAAYAWMVVTHRVCTYLRTHQEGCPSAPLGRNASRIRRTLPTGAEGPDSCTDRELAAASGLSERTVSAVRPWLSPVWLDAAKEEGGLLNHELVAPGLSPGMEVEKLADREQLQHLLSQINWKDRYLLQRVYGLDGEDPVSIRSAVVALGCSPQRGAFRVNRGLRKLRELWRD